MRKAVPAILITAAAFVVVWRFEPTNDIPSAAAPSTSTGAAEPGTPSGGHSGDRSVLGSAESTRWGPVQVRAVFSNGVLSDIQVVQAPNDGPTNRALPQLEAAALQLRGAEIDTVTGATMTSEAYIRSLQSALDAG